MVLIALKICADMLNVAKMELDQEDIHFFLKIKCTNCQEEFPKWQSVELNSSITQGRAKINYKANCKICSRLITIEIIKESIKNYILENNETFQTLCVFNCKGCDLTAYDFRRNWKVTANSGLIFEDADLSSNDWIEYDDREECPVSIEHLKFQFEKIKN